MSQPILDVERWPLAAAVVGASRPHFAPTAASVCSDYGNSGSLVLQARKLPLCWKGDVRVQHPWVNYRVSMFGGSRKRLHCGCISKTDT